VKDAKIAVLMTCHNRRDLTLSSIAAVLESGNRAGVSLEIYLTDDGSTDGTAEMVGEHFPKVTIIHGDGSLFWNQGMLRAWKAAATRVQDFYLWLNDDLVVFPDALANMLRCYGSSADPKTIVAGRTVDPVSGVTTYGAYARAPGLSRLRFRHVDKPSDVAVTMNGNLVLIPASAVADIGMNNSAFRHSTGDVDYGLRATRAGYAILQCPQPVGEQERNHAYALRTSRMTFGTMGRMLRDPKGVDLREWLTFTRDHGGPLWPVNFGWRYCKMLVTGYHDRLRGQG
jgi:GT2 family glycosyltransferase